ncbi:MULTISPECIES: hypothetical protein [Paenibacillus]|uniref:hypothetical protein n=1 Tax=Paenibacillus TaxID=44249 RepID=UPI0012FE048A|nr:MULTISPECIES: hypothetical protein [Paenibacillus]
MNKKYRIRQLKKQIERLTKLGGCDHTGHRNHGVDQANRFMEANVDKVSRVRGVRAF